MAKKYTASKHLGIHINWVDDNWFYYEQYPPRYSGKTAYQVFPNYGNLFMSDVDYRISFRNIDVSFYAYTKSCFLRGWKWYNDDWLAKNILPNNSDLKYNRSKVQSGWITEGKDLSAIAEYFLRPLINPDTKKTDGFCVFYSDEMKYQDLSEPIIVGIGRISDVRFIAQAKADQGLAEDCFHIDVKHTIRWDGADGFIMPYIYRFTYYPDGVTDLLVKVPKNMTINGRGKPDYLSEDALLQILNECIESLRKTAKIDPDDEVIEKCQRHISWCQNAIESLIDNRQYNLSFRELIQAVNMYHSPDSKEKKDQLDYATADELYQIIKNDNVEPADYMSALCSLVFSEPFDNYDFGSWEENEDLYQKIDKTRLQENLRILFPNGIYTDRRVALLRLMTILAQLELSDTDLFQIIRPYFSQKVEVEPVLKNLFRLYEDSCRDNYSIISYEMINTLCTDKFLEFYNNAYASVETAKDDLLLNPDKIPLYRLRAAITGFLEYKARNGHTIAMFDEVLEFLKANGAVTDENGIEDLLIRCYDYPYNPITVPEDAALILLSENSPLVFIEKQSADKTDRYIKLRRLVNVRQSINDVIRDRIQKQDYNATFINDDKTYKNCIVSGERINILKQMCCKSFYVLSGGAGTGKTTLIGDLARILLANEAGQIVLLAPTGLARSRLADSFGSQNFDQSRVQVKTIASFLHPFGWFQVWRMIYEEDKTLTLDFEDNPEQYSLAVIDEASMLTEDMFAALLEVLKHRADRIVFVGDRNQLPPIGPGRPYIDLIRYIRAEQPEMFSELTSNFRQGGGKNIKQFDVQFAAEFTDAGSNNTPIDKENRRLSFVSYSTEKSSKNDLYTQLNRLMQITCKMQNTRKHIDYNNFNRSLGASQINNVNYSSDIPLFNVEAAKSICDWQIITPVNSRLQINGAKNINKIIHYKYRELEGKRNNLFQRSKNSSTTVLPYPKGTEGIMMGDKVISTTNIRRLKKYEYIPNQKGRIREKVVADSENDAINIANGDIGIVCSVGDGKSPELKTNTAVAFTSQPGYFYFYDNSVFYRDGGRQALELAYAISVHKSQGSQFDQVILIISKDNRNISREMIYTALTRHKKKLWILSDLEDLGVLTQYSSYKYSETLKRLTDLFQDPQPEMIDNDLYDIACMSATDREQYIRDKELIDNEELDDGGAGDLSAASQ